MIFKIIMILCGIFGIIKFKDTKYILGKIILIGLLLTIVFSLIPFEPTKPLIFPLLMITSLLTLIYSYVYYNKEKNKLTAIFMIAFPTLIATSFKYFQFPFTTETLILSLFALVCFIYILWNKKIKLNKEISFLTIFAGNSIFLLYQLILSFM